MRKGAKEKWRESDDIQEGEREREKGNIDRGNIVRNKTERGSREGKRGVQHEWS